MFLKVLRGDRVHEAQEREWGTRADSLCTPTAAGGGPTFSGSFILPSLRATSRRPTPTAATSPPPQVWGQIGADSDGPSALRLDIATQREMVCGRVSLKGKL